MSEKLKPCPFCGDEAVLTGGRNGWFRVRCARCHASTADCDTKHAACERWNGRAEASEPCGSPEATAHDVPHHYEGDGIVTCADAMRSMTHLVTLSPMAIWWWACAFKYLWRWPWKNGAEDLRRVYDCIDRLLKEVGE